MPEKSWARSKPAVGLIVRIGRYSRFWGWTTQAPVAAAPSQTAAAQNCPRPVTAWSNVAEWLRCMHAQADHSPVDSLNQEK